MLQSSEVALRSRTILSDAPPAGEWLSAEDIAADTGVCVGTLANWRCKGIGPAFYKFGKKVRYGRGDYRTWRDGARVRTRNA
jgi:hypothetical protein